MGKYAPIDLHGLHTLSLRERTSKVHVGDFGKPPREGASFAEFFSSLPNILKGADIRGVVEAIVCARLRDRPVLMGMGAHVIKCGLSPVVADLVRRGVVTALAFNGAGPIHDVEVALVGRTSEDVQPGLQTGSFGMARETGEVIQNALARAQSGEVGFGRAVGDELLRIDPPYRRLSLLAVAAERDIPATVHVAIGTDIVQMRSDAMGAAIGAASYHDFRLFTSVVADLSGGVYLNVGSAVILPEVFLKAFTIAQNLGADLQDFTTVNLDMITHYRPLQNVVQRPAGVGGKGYALTGHHEILIPLLAHAVLDALHKAPPSTSEE